MAEIVLRGETLKQAREALGWSLGQLAAAAELPGGRGHVWKLEAGRWPSAVTQERIAKALEQGSAKDRVEASGGDGASPLTLDQWLFRLDGGYYL